MIHNRLLKFDNKIINYFCLLKNYLETFLLIKKILNFFAYIKNFILIPNFCNILINFPNLLKLLQDLSLVFNSNKDFICCNLRIYFYSVLIVYCFVFCFNTIFIFSKVFALIKVAYYLQCFYHYWTYPIRHIRCYIKYIFLIPFNIIKYIITFLIFILKHLADIIKKIFNKKPGECVSKNEEDFEKKINVIINDTGLSPNFGRQSFLSSTEWELNCMENKAKKIFNIANTTSNLKNAA